MVAFFPDEPPAIYPWLQVPDSGQPVAIALPWHEGEAAAFHRAAEQAKAMGAALKMRGHERDGNRIPGLHRMAPKFYPAPAPSLPRQQSP